MPVTGIPGVSRTVVRERTLTMEGGLTNLWGGGRSLNFTTRNHIPPKWGESRNNIGGNGSAKKIKIPIPLRVSNGIALKHF